MTLGRICVVFVERMKRLFRCKTWHIEAAFVLGILSAVALLAHRGWIEWIGVFAVWFTFMHASVSNRLEEAEHRRQQRTGMTDVHCYRWSTRYFYLKETCWLLYFSLIGAWSALVGVGIFLAYGWWRRTWRKAHPVR